VLGTLTNKANPVFDCRPNEKHILDILRQTGKASKAQIARMTKLTAVAVGSLMKSLHDKGLVEPVGKVQGDMGQPATLYAISGEGAYSLGVSINRGQFELVLMNLVGDVIASRKHEWVLASPAVVCETISKDLTQILESVSSDVQEKILGIGVAKPYNIGSQQKQVESWQAWADFDVNDKFRHEFGLPVLCENDVNAAAMAEHIYGSVSKAESFLYLFFGGALATSLGSAIFLDGRCWSGANGNAGDMALGPAGDPKAKELFADYCSLNSLVTRYLEDGGSIESHADLTRAIEAKPEVYEQWSENWVSYFMQFLNATQALLDLPEYIVDCDDVAEPIVTNLLDKVMDALPDAMIHGLSAPKITRGSFAGQAAARGAASLPIDAVLNPRAQKAFG